jgi:septal ring factor EnvC (AmiA/AmiB activator)
VAPRRPTPSNLENSVNKITHEMDWKADALATVTQMAHNLEQLAKDNAQLKADLNQERDRCTMLIEERNHYRNRFEKVHREFMRSCTTIANMGLLARDAEDSIRSMEDPEIKQPLPVLDPPITVEPVK